MAIVEALTEADPRLLAIAGGVASAVYLNKHAISGDIGLLVEVALGALLYVIQRSVNGVDIGKAIGFALTMVAYQALTLAAATIAWRISPWHPLAKFPGPFLNKVTSLKLAHMVYSGKRYLVVTELHKKYGTFVRTGPNTLSINSTKAGSTIYASSAAWSKSDAYVPGKVHGDGLFFIRDRDEHNVRRKIWAPGFTPAAIASYKPTVERRTQQLLDTAWKRREGTHGTIDLTMLLQHWSYDVMGELSYGRSNKIEMMEEGDPNGYVDGGQLATVVFESLGETPALFKILSYLPVADALTKLEKLGARLIMARKNSNEGASNDLASHLLGEHDPSLPKLNDRDLTVDSLFAIQAGSDTTSGVLTFLFYYLLRDGDSYARLTAELDEAFPDPDAPLNLQTLNKLPYLSAVVDESLRLGTPFPGLPRIVPEGGHTFDDVFVPEGTIVGIPVWAQQTSPDNFYPEPLEFRPQRWMPGGLGPGSKLVKQALFSFSFGPFGCLGKPLAHQEMRVVAAKMLLTYNMKLSPEFDNKKFVAGIDNMRATLFRYPLLITAERRHNN